MAINRYVDVNFDQPISNHVPLPLEMMYKLGKDASKDYEDTISGVTTAKGLLSKHKTQTSIKVYDASAPDGVRDAQVNFEPQRQAYQSKLQTEMESITNDYIKDKDTAKFKQRMNSLKGQAVAMDNDLATKSALVEKIEKHNEEIAKNQDMSLSPFLRNQELAYNTSIYNDLAQGKSDYSPYNVAKPTDRPKEIKETFSSLGEEVLQSFSNATGDGYIRSKYREGRTKDKIDNVFTPWYENSAVKQDIKLEANDFFARRGVNPNDIYEVIKDEKGNEIKVTNFDKFESQKIAELANVARGYSTSKGKDDLNADSTWQYQDKKKKEEIAAAALTGSSIESNTFNLSNLDPEYKYLRDGRILKEGPDGAIKVNWARGASDKGLKAWDIAGTKVFIWDDRDNMSTDDQVKLAKQMDKMARAVGWYSITDNDGNALHKDLKANDFDKIATAYNLMSKSRLPGEQLNPVIRNIQNSKVAKDWENYQAYDPANIDNPTAEKPTVSKKDGDEINIQNRVTNSKGESILTGVVRHKDGSTTPLALRANSKQEDMYFSTVGSIGSQAAKYMVGATKPIRTNSDGTHTVQEMTLPGTGFKVTTLANPNKKMNQQYVVEIPKEKKTAAMSGTEYTTTKDGTLLRRFENYGELQLFLNNSWYTSTPYGQTEITESQSNNEQAKNY